MNRVSAPLPGESYRAEMEAKSIQTLASLRNQFKLSNPSKEKKQAALSNALHDHPPVRVPVSEGAEEPIPDVPDSVHLSDEELLMFEEDWDEQAIWDLMQQNVPDALIRPSTPAEPCPPSLDNLDILRLYLGEHHQRDFRLACLASQRARAQSLSKNNHYHIVLQLDIGLLANLNADLGNMLLCDMTESLQKEFANHCFDLLREQVGDPSELLPEHVRVTLRLAYLPGIQDFHLKSFKTLFLGRNNFEIQNRSCQITGMITQVHRPARKLLSQTYFCVQSGCHNRDSLHVARSDAGYRIIKRCQDHHLLLTETRTEIKTSDLACSHCGSLMEESVVDRVCSLEQIIIVTSLDNTHCFSSSITCFISDDLVGKAELGDLVSLIGYVRPKDAVRFKGQWKVPYGINFQVNNLFQCQQIGGEIQRADRAKSFFVEIPYSIDSLLKSGASPFTVAMEIVSQFQDKLVPPNLFVKLRLALLLSLVSNPMSSNSESATGPLNILITTNSHQPWIARLMEAASSMKRTTWWNRGAEPRRPSLLDQHANVANVTPLWTAKDGILKVETNDLSKRDKKQLIHALTTKSYSLFADEDLVLEAHTNNCVWALHVHPASSRPKPGGYLSSFASNFDICINLCTSTNQAFDAEICDTLLLGDGCQFPNDDDSARISNADFIQLIKAASNFNVKTTPESDELLQAYHTALKDMIDQSNDQSIPGIVPLETLYKIASCHAKLCLRNLVLVDDALVSIMMAEETMAYFAGTSLLGFSSLPQDQQNLTMVFGGHEDDDDLDIDTTVCKKSQNSDDDLSELDKVYVAFYEALTKAI